jgi:hypothetical protein
MTSGCWAPTPKQIEVVIDCSTARMSLERTAELAGVRPRTVQIFAKRHGMLFPASPGRSRTAISPAPVVSKPTPAQEGGL